MIYVIESSGYKKKDSGERVYFSILKIGFTEDSNKERRYGSYRNHNPCSEVLFEIPGGTEDHEKRLHYKFRDLLLYGNEWFKYDQKIIDYFNSGVTLVDFESLPKNPGRENYQYKEIRKSIRKINYYFFETRSEADNYLEKVCEILGDKLSRDSYFELIKRDLGEDKVNQYLSLENTILKGDFTEDSDKNIEISKFFQKYLVEGNIIKRVQYLCELNEELTSIGLLFIPNSDPAKKYYISIGRKRIRELGYNITRLEKELGIIETDKCSLEEYIYQNFKVGDKIPLSEIKERLRNIYTSVNYKATPKAKNIERYFEVREISIYEKDSNRERKKVRGFELLKKKR